MRTPARFVSSVTRRHFVAASAATIGAPWFVPRHVLGGNGQVGPHDKINVGLIGIGKMMHDSHLPHLVKMPEVKVVAVCDVDTTRRESGKKRVDETYENTDCAMYDDYRELLKRDGLDAILCATPDHWHAMVILDACSAGKDIYCEKPLTNNLMEAKQVMDAVKKSKIIFQTGSQQRSDNEFRLACELVRNGHIGKVTRINVGVGGPPKPCNLPGEEMEPGLDWERWMGAAPMRPYSSVLSPRGIHNHFPSWRNFSEYGGGGMTDWGAHHFDIAQWGMDMDGSGPVEIIPAKPGESSGIKYLYANGIEVTHGGEGGVTFFGSSGEIFVNRGKLTSTPEGIIQTPITDSEIHLYKSPSGGHSGHRQDWVNCMKSRKQPNCPIEIGARTVAVCHLGNIAYAHSEELAGKSLRWDPMLWKFVGNDAANAWQDYPYQRRQGYQLPIARV